MDLLLVEDKDSFRRLLSQALEGTVWKTLAVADPQEALRALEERPFHVLVTDLRLPGMSGLELIRRARRLHPGLRVVLMSAFGEPRDIVEAMRLGADDFLPKPFDLDAFLALLDRLRALVGAPPPDPAEPWIAHSPAMLALDGALRQAAATPLPVLFRGPRGSGRERCARRLHTLRHPAAPYLTLPAAILGPEGPDPRLLQLLEGGSLFLPGLEHLSAGAVGALARAMDAGPGTRLAWMGSVESEVQLPPEITQRLGALELRVPPLKERREDLLALTRQLLDQAAKREGRPMPWLERSAERQLLDHSWPGNVRELEVLVGRTLLFSEGHAIRSFPDLGLGQEAPLCLPWPVAGGLDGMLKAVAWGAEGKLLERALAMAAGDLPRASESLGLTVRTLAQRLREHGIPLEDGERSASRKSP
ncbi:MAG: sigma-54-dependent Fis family transcriptional regulator [Holophagaceae bacterium]|uniref:Sigma-54-dependent Fis family transcriptional regulator n=1 Tax=Candidatus Geothrix skivensis TaxID=2954439 RepID=A0A9D7XH29_9BACT|nr:sigma-54-dependent Fis family transcriptional regulator [Candidatus Geothrix skivensis]